jgi:acetylornithine deacetylase/succinyl-diaminopimelate desuccinylase-like protein
MPAVGALKALNAHLQKRVFGDLEVNMTGGYDPTTTPADSAFIKNMEAVYRKMGIDPLLWPRSGGSWPGYLFTEKPLGLPAGHYGLGHGSGAHAPDEYLVIEATDPKVAGFDAAVNSHVAYLETLAD